MRKWCVLFSVGIIIILVNLDMTIVNLAIPELSKEFLAPIQQVKWVLISYYMGSALFFCFFGKLADFVGKKNVFLIGCVLFVLSSIVLSFAPFINILILGRFIQGLGFAATLGLAVVLIVQAFPAQRKGLATGSAVTLTGLAMALGPPLGGIILSQLGWRWIFLLNVPLGIISILLTIIFVRKDDNSNRMEKNFNVDILSSIFYILGVSILIYSLNEINNFTNSLLLLFILSIILIVFFVWRSLNVKNPLIGISLLKNLDFLIILSIRFLFMIVMTSLLFLLPIYLQNILHSTQIETGIKMLYMTAIIAILSPFTGKLMDIIGFKIPLTFSIISLLISCIFLLNLKGNNSTLFLILGLIFFGFSVGVQTSSSINGALSQVLPQNAGVAIGLFFTLAMIGAMTGTSLTGIVLERFINTIGFMHTFKIILQVNLSVSFLGFLFCLFLQRATIRTSLQKSAFYGKVSRFLN